MTLKSLAACLLLLAVGCGDNEPLDPNQDGGPTPDTPDGPNHAPVTAADEATTAEDTPVTVDVLANDSDPDGDTLQVRVVSLPAGQGRVVVDGTKLRIEPAQDFHGDIVLDYGVTDSKDVTDASLLVHVTPVNDAPTAAAPQFATGRNEPLSFQLLASDVDADPLTFEVLTQPTHGTLSGAAPNLTYTPQTGFSGTDTFTFVARDAELPSEEKVATIVVADSERPVGEDQSVTVTEDGELAIELHATDGDGDPLTYAVSQQPLHGTLTGTPPNLTYHPTANYSGSDGFNFTANDGTLTSFAKSVAIDVTATPDAPVADAQTVEVTEDVDVSFSLTGSDADGTPLTYAVAQQPGHGTLSISGASATYSPADNYNGPDTFIFTVTSGGEVSAPATVMLNVASVPDKPVAQGQSVTVAEDGDLAIELHATDGDGDSLTYAVTQQPLHGTLTGTPPNLTYHPTANYSGSDSFTFTANDGTQASEAKTVGIDITAMPDAPVANAQTVEVTEDVAASFSLTGSDGDGTPLTYAVAQQPSHGTLSTSGASITYTPNENYNGPDSFTFTVTSGGATSAPAPVTLNIAPVPDKPVAQNDWVSLPEDTTKAFTLEAIDPDGNPTTFTVTPPTVGTLTGTPPNLVYTPPENFASNISFTFTASDDAGSTTATVWLMVQSVNDAPVATGASISTNEDTATTVTLTATDVDSPASSLVYSILTPPTGGTVALSGATATYTPGADRTDPDSFVFRVRDNHNATASATVTIAIAPVNDAPRPRRDIVQIEPGAVATIDVIGNDEDPDGDVLDLVSAGSASHGTTSVEADDVRYTPFAGFTGSDKFSYAVTDPSGLEATAIAYIGVGIFPGGIPLLAIASTENVLGSDYQTYLTDLSADGRYVALVSAAKLVAADTNDSPDVYVYDRLEDTFDLISVRLDGEASGGAAGTNWPGAVSISDDGRYVAFTVYGSGIVANDVNCCTPELYVRDRVEGTTVMASVSTEGTQPTATSLGHVALSGDGRHVAFVSNSDELAAGDDNQDYDLFVRDLDTGITERIGFLEDGDELFWGAFEDETIAIDADGSVIAFVFLSTATTNGGGWGYQMNVVDRTAGTITRVSKMSSGAYVNGDSSSPALSADGSVVAFVSTAPLVSDDTNGVADVFVHDRTTGITTRSPITDAAALDVAISANGHVLATRFDGDTDRIVVVDRITGLSQNVSLNPDGTVPTAGSIDRPSISADGRYVSFVSDSSTLGADPQPTGADVFVGPTGF